MVGDGWPRPSDASEFSKIFLRKSMEKWNFLKDFAVNFSLIEGWKLARNLTLLAGEGWIEQGNRF